MLPVSCSPLHVRLAGTDPELAGGGTAGSPRAAWLLSAGWTSVIRLPRLALVAQCQNEESVFGFDVLVEREITGAATGDDQRSETMFSRAADERMTFENAYGIQGNKGPGPT